MTEQEPDEIVRATIKKIERVAEAEEKRAHRLRWSNSLFSFAAAVLGVGAPTFVAYFVQQDNGGAALKIIAIIAVAFAGATTVLLNTFRWGQRYGQSSLAAISLRELASSTQLRLLDINRTVTKEARAEKFHLLNHESQKELFGIRRSVIQNEAAVFSKTPEGGQAGSPSAGGEKIN